MSKPFIILLMVFCHIIDDYCLQGILASMKQRSWWKENAPDKLYRYDYLVALVIHGLSWTFMVMLPIAIHMNFRPALLFYVLFFANVAIHSYVDDLKANRHKINLVTDQTIHIVQIIVTAALLLR